MAVQFTAFRNFYLFSSFLHSYHALVPLLTVPSGFIHTNFRHDTIFFFFNFLNTYLQYYKTVLILRFFMEFYIIYIYYVLL